ncbi:MAG: glycine zipper family protein, partial [Deltaproteobacteria bacterium]|nr:glycine zipper family protein [Deltaproteobacteria bacterium]
MKKYTVILLVTISIIVSSGCSKTYKAKPMPFKMPSAYDNVVNVDGTELAAKAFADIDEAKDAFGFDIRSAGMLPVQVVFDNRGIHSLEINAQQTFLEDTQGNLWPILSNKL